MRLNYPYTKKRKDNIHTKKKITGQYLCNSQKYTSKWIQQYIERVTHHCQVGLIPGMQGWFSICKSINVMLHIDRIKDKNHWIISIDADKSINIFKMFNKMGIECKYLNLIRAIYDKTSADGKYQGWKTENFPLMSGTKQRCLLW